MEVRILWSTNLSFPAALLISRKQILCFCWVCREFLRGQDLIVTGLDILRVELFMDGSFRNAFCSDNKEKTTYECK